ncbi:phosphate acyltransferase PlsX [Tepiditoga spiralis]|uniref:phosphate acyltransferase PlsX n=1 Tax=Tepiditoga spiralis TaxID=2108365 RepID=UPI003B8454B4
MSNLKKIGIDLYGGDNAPESVIQGAIFALENKFLNNCELVIVGNKKDYSEKFNKFNNVSFIDAENTVDNHTKPTQALKMKTSSIYKGCELLKNKELDAFVSAGNTGALLSAGTFVAGRLKGIKRPALAVALPSKTTPKILIDAGANAEVKPEFFYDFAREGIAYADFMGIKNPKIAILNIGTEEGKGSTLVKNAANYLKEKNLNYVGFIEGRDVFTGDYDILITDGFTGNTVLKTIEGTAYYILSELKASIKKGGLFAKLGALMMKGSLYSLKTKLDYRQYGGTFFLGVNGILVKAHGSSDSEAIANALYVASEAAKKDIVSRITKEV